MRDSNHVISIKITTRRFRNIFTQRLSCLVRFTFSFFIFTITWLLQNTVEIGLVNFDFIFLYSHFEYVQFNFVEVKIILSIGFWTFRPGCILKYKARTKFAMEWLSDFWKSIKWLLICCRTLAPKSISDQMIYSSNWNESK